MGFESGGTLDSISNFWILYHLASLWMWIHPLSNALLHLFKINVDVGVQAHDKAIRRTWFLSPVAQIKENSQTYKI